MSKCSHRLGQIPATRFVKVEQNRDVLVCAQGFSECIKDGFALRREATKNEDGFPGNGVDDLTNFRIIQQQIDELGNLEIIDGNGWFLGRSDDQVVLSS